MFCKQEMVTILFRGCRDDTHHQISQAAVFKRWRAHVVWVVDRGVWSAQAVVEATFVWRSAVTFVPKHKLFNQMSKSPSESRTLTRKAVSSEMLSTSPVCWESSVWWRYSRSSSCVATSGCRTTGVGENSRKIKDCEATRPESREIIKMRW